MASNPFNALMDPAQVGMAFQGAFQAGQERAREIKTQQALSDYLKNPSEQTVQGVGAHNAMLGIKLQGMEQDRQASQQQAATNRLKNIATLARGVKDETTYQRALQIAQQMGIDTTGAPANYDPAWVAQQAQTYEFFAGEDGQKALSDAGKRATDMGYQPGTPEFSAAVTEIVKAGLAKPYIDEKGQTRLYQPSLTFGAAAQQGEDAVQEGATATNPQTGEKIIFRNGQWQAAGGGGGNATGGFR